MNQLSLSNSTISKTQVIASSGIFKIELLKHVGEDDYSDLILISKALEEDYSLPFIARYRDQIVGYIIGIPLEELSHEPWARMDENFGKRNTLYTYAFVVDSEFKGNGYAKMLKRVFLSWAEKNNQIDFITGHVINGISAQFTGDIRIVNRIENWQGTGKSFEYYRRNITSKGATEKNDPPLINRT